MDHWAKVRKGIESEQFFAKKLKTAAVHELTLMEAKARGLIPFKSKNALLARKGLGRVGSVEGIKQDMFYGRSVREY